MELEIIERQIRYSDVYLPDLSERKSPIIIHNVTYSQPNSGVILKPYNFNLFSRVNILPDEKDEFLTFKTLTPLKYHEQVVHLQGNGTIYFGLNIGL